MGLKRPSGASRGPYKGFIRGFSGDLRASRSFEP